MTYAYEHGGELFELGADLVAFVVGQSHGARLRVATVHRKVATTGT